MPRPASLKAAFWSRHSSLLAALTNGLVDRDVTVDDARQLRSILPAGLASGRGAGVERLPK
jgi:hypothetical protein